MTLRSQAVLGCLLAAPDADGATDADLLACFTQCRDEAAFELLVWRHAGMVLRACRSILRDHHAAEDACQATFLALARQSRAVGRRGPVAGWLYTVARRIAARSARRRCERPTLSDGGLDQLLATPAEPTFDTDAVRLLFNELDRLPDKYRSPLLLCFLDGLSHADAARRLGVPVGTVAGRVARAKERLHRRLAARGVAIPAAGLGVLVALSSVGAVAPAFVAATARAAVALAVGGSPDVSNGVLALAKGEVRAMTTTKLQWAAGVLTACGALAFGAAWAAAPGGDPAALPAAGPPVVAASDPPAPVAPDRRGGAKEDDPVKLFAAMQQKVAAAKTFRVRFDLSVTGADGGKGTVKGSLTLGEGDRYRVELDGKIFGQVVKEVEVSDGTTINSVGSGPVAGVEKSPKGAGVYLRRAVPVEGFFLASLNLGRRGDRKAAEFLPTDLKAGGKENVAGREAHVVHFTLPAGRDGAGAKGMPETVWLDVESGLPLQFAVTGGTSDVREVTETYAEFVLDPKVDAKVFELPTGKAPPADDPLKKELAKLEGTWIVVKMEVNGKSVLEEGKPEPPLVIKDGEITSDAGDAPGGAVELAKVLDPTKTPKQITVPNSHGGDPKAGVTLIGIYEVSGDELRFCVQEVETAKLKEREKERPTAFDSNKGVLTVYKRADDKADDAKKLQGIWVVDRATFEGVPNKDLPADLVKDVTAMRFTFRGDEVTIKGPVGPDHSKKEGEQKSSFRLDPTASPKRIDLSDSELGIYEFEGDTLRLCWDIRGKENGRPTRFGFDKGKATVVYYVLKREMRADDPKPQREDAAIEKVVADALESGRKMDWKRYAELVHPDSLQDYKDMWLPLLQAATKGSPDKQADLLAAFDKATDLKAVIALKPKEFFVSSMKGMAAQFPELKASSLNVAEKIVGTVHEGKDRAYVVVRTRGLLPRTEMTKVEVIALKRSGTEWKMMLPDVIRVMAETTGRARPDTQKAGPVKDRADPDK